MYRSIGRFTTALVVTAVAASLTGCDREVVGPEQSMPPAPHSEISTASAPANDDFDAAVVVTNLPFTHTLNTSDATAAEDDPHCYGPGPTVWYAFTPAVSGTYEANTFGSDYDTTLGAHTGTRGDLTQIACNDDAGGLQSRVVLDLVAGQTVYFMVGAYAMGPGGNLVFHLDVWSPPPPPPPFTVGLTLDRAGSVDAQTGIATVGGAMTCSLWSYVNLYGVLRQRIGRVIVEAPFWGFFTCDGTTPWQVEVRAQNALLVAGPVEVQVQAYFYDPVYGQSAFAQASGTVHLRGGGGRSSASAAASPASTLNGEALRSLEEVIRNDPRLKRTAKAP